MDYAALKEKIRAAGQQLGFAAIGVARADPGDAVAGLRAWLAEKGFDPLMGARPMARLIQDTIRSALADELLFGRLVHGGRVTIDIDDQEKVRLGFDEVANATPVPSSLE